MGGSWRIGRIGGIPISIDAGWFVAVFAISWSLASGFLPDRLPGQPTSTYWIIGTIGALLLFGSVLVHELGHAITALRFGIQVEGITLLLFGGVAELREEPKRPRDEFLIAVAGPVASVIVAAVTFLVARIATGPVGVLAEYLAFTNAILVVFNLVPGFPLDGGRMLRAAVWAATNDVQRATRLASLFGQGFALLLIVFGFFRILSGDVSGGLWTGFIGWYLFGAATSSQRSVSVATNLRGIRVADVMDTSPPTISPNLPLNHFIQEFVIREGLRAAVIVTGDKPWGIVSLADVRKIPSEEWATTLVAQVATRPPLVSLMPQDTLEEALNRLAEKGVNQIIVIDESGRLVGTVTRAGILAVLQLQRDAPAIWARRGAPS